MNKELAQQIYEISHLSGMFKLRSGKLSTTYFDKYQFESHPNLLLTISDELAKILPSETQVLAGLELGGIPLATAVSLKTGLPVVFVRKERKEYGTQRIAEGVNITGKSVCIIEDVVTSGGQIIESSRELAQEGAFIGNVLCVILREESALDNMRKNSLDLKWLFTAADLANSVGYKV